MAKEIEVFEPQGAAYVLDFVAVAVDGPEAWVVRIVRVKGAELVVVIEFDSGLGKEVLEAAEVNVVKARTAVQQQHLDGRVAHALYPDLILAAAYWNKLRSAAFDLCGVGLIFRRRLRRFCQTRDGKTAGKRSTL